MTRLVLFFAHGFGAGRIPVAPGTFGTAVAIPLYLLARSLPIGLYVAMTVLLFIVGIWICDVAAGELRQADPAPVVWDEIVGYLVTMTAAPGDWVWIAVGFLLFRLFDIWKPWPIGELDEQVAGGLGIMLDDLVAGIFALVVLQGAVRAIAALS